MNKKLRKYIANTFPEPIKVSLYKAWQFSNDIRLTLYPVRYRTSLTNAFVCTVHKAGSQWIKSIIFDSQVYKYSGLKPQDIRSYGVEEKNYPNTKYNKPFPKHRILVPLFIEYDNFQSIPKTDDYRAFFVMRDPRDIVVSYYFSMRDSHTPMGDILKKRAILKSLDVKQGLQWTIEYLFNYGLFDALKSWKKAQEADPKIMVVTYEDLVGDEQLDYFRKVFAHCDIAIPDSVLVNVLKKYSFAEMRKTDWRINQTSHYRKGRPGDWQNHFHRDHIAFFQKIAGDLIEYLDYSW
jgi:hypothetical protein